jgi:hypothetical protein
MFDILWALRQKNSSISEISSRLFLFLVVIWMAGNSHKFHEQI